MKMLQLSACFTLASTLIFAPVADATRLQYSVEKFELSQLRVWHVHKDACGYTATVLDPEGFGHEVRVAGYIGSSNGKITSMDFSGIDIVELIPDGAGGWKEVQRRLENPSHEYDMQAHEQAEDKK